MGSGVCSSPAGRGVLRAYMQAACPPRAIARLGNGASQLGDTSVVPVLVLTAIALPAVLLRRVRRQRCDWCGGRFDRNGDCEACRRPA
jgi:hypothetical protein